MYLNVCDLWMDENERQWGKKEKRIFIAILFCCFMWLYVKNMRHFTGFTSYSLTHDMRNNNNFIFVSASTSSFCKNILWHSHRMKEERFTHESIEIKSEWEKNLFIYISKVFLLTILLASFFYSYFYLKTNPQMYLLFGVHNKSLPEALISTNLCCHVWLTVIYNAFRLDLPLLPLQKMNIKTFFLLSMW